MAQALLDKGDAPGAAAQFFDCAQGSFADNPDVLTGLAEAQFASGNATAVGPALAALFKQHPVRDTGAAAPPRRRQAAVCAADQGRRTLAITHRSLQKDWLRQARDGMNAVNSAAAM